jgi:CBS domain-containing protein
MFKAQDLMTTQVVTVNVDDTIDHAITLMVRHRISGLPVLDREGRPVGIISEFDLLELISEGQTEQDVVSHYMSPELFGVAEEDSWVTVVDAFRAKHFRRLPVLREGKLVGIVTRHDLMHAIRDARQRVRQQLTQEASKTPHRTRTETAPVAQVEPANPARDNPFEPVAPAMIRAER